MTRVILVGRACPLLYRMKGRTRAYIYLESTDRDRLRAINVILRNIYSGFYPSSPVVDSCLANPIYCYPTNYTF